MTFGQTSGPPATAAQLSELADLFEQVGFGSFREARHPYDLSQRQSNGKFTRTEADELIDRLRDEVVDGPAVEMTDDSHGATHSVVRRPKKSEVPVVPAPTESAASIDVALAFPDELLADELRRRGWTCTPPAEAAG